MEEKDREDSVKHSNYEPTCKGCSAVESILCDIMPDCHFHRSAILLPIISRAGNTHKFSMNVDLCSCFLYAFEFCIFLVTLAVILIRDDHIHIAAFIFIECRLINA